MAFSSQLSANPDALDLANSRTPGPDSYPFHNRNRSTHQSMPQNISGVMGLDQLGSPSHEEHRHTTQSRHLARHSLEGGLVFPSERSSEAMTPVPSNRPTSLQSSYSTNDLPTVKGADNNNKSGFDAAITPPKTHTEHLHSHNASMGRIPTGAVNRQSRDTSESDGSKNGQSTPTLLHGNAVPFGPQLTSAAPNTGITAPTVPFPPLYNYGMPPAYGGQAVQNNNQLPGFPAANAYGGYANYSNYRYNEAGGRNSISSQRRQTEGEATQLTRFANFPLEHYKGELYNLCKDQHGCRYLQRKLEERNPDHVQLIFSETYMHVIELMTGTRDIDPTPFLVPYGTHQC